MRPVPAAGEPVMPEVKICGCRRSADAVAVAEAGADYFGLVFAGTLRRVNEEEAAAVVAAARDAAARAGAQGPRPVGVFVDEPEDRVRAAAERLGLRIVQLHGAEDPAGCDRLRGAALQVWKALRPRAPDELARLVDRYAGAVDAVLVEGYSPHAAGGTGSTVPHEWLDPRGPGRVRVPRLVLAGGLEPGNVAAAVRAVRPAVVDVSSGVERAPGDKDPVLIRRFVAAARGALAGTRR